MCIVKTKCQTVSILTNFLIFNVLQAVRLSTTLFWDRTPLRWVIGAGLPNGHDALIFQRSRGRMILPLDRVAWKRRDAASRPRAPES